MGMKILSVANEIKSDIKTSGTKLKKATTDGYYIADRTAKVYKQCNFHRLINITRSISDKIKKSTTKKELPYAAGALGLLIPFPLISPLFMALGFLFSYSNSKFNNKSEQERLNKNA